MEESDGAVEPSWQPQAHMPPDLCERVISLVLSAADPDASHKASIRNVYVFGSRLFGVHKPGSDYDFVVLVEGEYFVGPKLIEEGDLNVNLFHYAYFSLLIKENLPWCCMFPSLPASHIIKQELPLFPDGFPLKKPSLAKMAITDARHNLQKAKRSWREGDKYKARKNIVHGIRFLGFAVQLLQHGKIVDLTEATPIWKEVMEDTADDWDPIESKYKVVYENLYSKVNAMAQPLLLDTTPKLRKGIHPKKERGRPGIEGSKGEGEGTEGKRQHPLKTVAYIERFGLEALTKELAIAATRHPKYPNLIHLCADKVDSPQDNEVVSECAYGIILDERDDWRIIAFPYEKFFGHYRTEAFELLGAFDWANCKLYEKMDGCMAMVYNYNSEWFVASWETPDGSETITNALADDGKYYYHSRKPCYNPWQFFEAKLQWAWGKKNFPLGNGGGGGGGEGKGSEGEGGGGYYPNQIASIEASGVRYSHYQTTFADAFWRTWNKHGYRLPEINDAEAGSDTEGRKGQHRYCYMFVLRHEELHLVIARGPVQDVCGEAGGEDKKRETEEKGEEEGEGKREVRGEKGSVEAILLHGVRDVETLEEVEDFTEFAKRYNWRTVRQVFHPGKEEPNGSSGFGSLKSVVQWTFPLDPTVLCGAVAVGHVKKGSGGAVKIAENKIVRVKVKSAQYRALEKLCWRSDDEDRTRRLLFEIARANDCTTFKLRFPQWNLLYDAIKADYEEFCECINSAYRAAWIRAGLQPPAPPSNDGGSVVEGVEKGEEVGGEKEECRKGREGEEEKGEKETGNGEVVASKEQGEGGSVVAAGTGGKGGGERVKGEEERVADEVKKERVAPKVILFKMLHGRRYDSRQVLAHWPLHLLEKLLQTWAKQNKHRNSAVHARRK